MKTNNISVNAFLNYTSILGYEHNLSNKGQEGPHRNTGFPQDPGEALEKLLERDEFSIRLDEAKSVIPMQRAKVSYYLESEQKEIDALYTRMGYVNLQRKGASRGLTQAQETSKASFFRNRHTNVIIFILDELYPTTWGAIFNAIVNNKTVMVRHGNQVLRKVQLNDKNFDYLSTLFQDAKVARGIAYNRKQIERQQIEHLTQFNNHETTVTKLALADTLRPLWNLDAANNYYEYQILMETINTYIQAQLPTEEIFVGDLQEEDNEFNSRGRELVRNLHTLPVKLRQQLKPLLNIKETTVESFGNEDLMDATLLGTV